MRCFAEWRKDCFLLSFHFLSFCELQVWTLIEGVLLGVWVGTG